MEFNAMKAAIIVRQQTMKVIAFHVRMDYMNQEPILMILFLNA